MKRRIHTLSLIAISILMAILLTSCGGKSDAPDKMQLVSENKEYGYSFYGPEGWVVANQGDIACTYVSNIDYSSATFAPLGQDAIAKDKTVKESVAAFFMEDTKRFLEEPFSDFTVSKDGEECKFGNADEAYKFTYSYTYKDKPYSCMQIIVIKDGAPFIFTYNASSQDYRDDKSFYQFYLTDYIQKIIDNFKFTEKTSSENETPEYERDSEGDLLVSRENECGFSLWVSESWKVDYSTALVSVSRDDGTNINVSGLINNTISIRDNYLARKEELSVLADKKENEDGTRVTTFEEIKGIKKDENGNESLHIIELENARSAAEFEYKYTLFGKTYHVYQVFIVNGHLNMEAFVFTFTAEEENYATHIDEAIAILNKIGF